PLPTCRRHYPGRSNGNLFAHTFPPSSAFLESEAGRPLHYAFRGLLSVHSRYGLDAHRVAYATFYTEGFSSFVASAAASVAIGWNEPVPGRDFSPAEDQRLFTAHSDQCVYPADVVMQSCLASGRVASAEIGFTLKPKYLSR